MLRSIAEDHAIHTPLVHADQPQAFFKVMLRDFGVKGLKVQEVVSLDDEMLEFLQYVT